MWIFSCFVFVSHLWKFAEAPWLRTIHLNKQVAPPKTHGIGWQTAVSDWQVATASQVSFLIYIA